MEFDPERGIGSRKPKMSDEEAMPMMLPKKNTTKLRLSSSLQDLSTYNHHNSLSFSKSKDFSGINTNSIKKKKKRWVAVASVVVVLLILASIFAYLSSANRSSFYVVIDSGSTGTRAYVYRSTPSRDRSSSLPFRIDDPAKKPNRVSAGRAYDRVETEPGFHKMVHNVTALRAAIAPLLRWARSQVPAGALGRTPVFLYATAGVRRLPPAHSKWVMDNAWPVLRDSPFVSRREWVRVLTGKEEAYFGWIALNYGSGVLGAVPRKPTLGALDLGGSSLQVTYETTAEAGAGLQLRIGTVKHQLTAYSLSGFGLNDAFDTSVGQLAVVKGEAKHPCLQTGYRERYKGRVTLVGAPDWDACIALAKQNGSQFTRPYGSFYAMSGFFVVYRFFNLSADAGLEEVLEKGKEFCMKTWEDARKSVPAQPFIEHYCFRAPYVVSLLRDGLRIPENQITIGSGSITWTLGVALMEAANASGTLHSGYLGGIAVLFILVVLFVLLLLGCAKFARTAGSGNGAGIGMVEGRVSISKTMSEIPTHSTNNLSNIQVEAFWSPHRTQMQLQSRRSQSREDLNSSIP